MKTLSLLGALTALTLLTGACKKADEPLFDAVITGNNQALCPCCGGLMINFNGETRPYTGDFKLIQNTDAELGISANDTFPLYVKVSWTPLSGGCGATRITITKLVRR